MEKYYSCAWKFVIPLELSVHSKNKWFFTAMPSKIHFFKDSLMNHLFLTFL